ncbi:hypothetical protein LXL04_033637 [Taraxacum kok-saghyz]
MFLSQKKYATDILSRAHMMTCKPCRTPADSQSKLGSTGTPVEDPTLYRSLAGALQYLTFTRPDIAFVVQQVCLYMHDPREPHLHALKRILRYLRGTLDHGIHIYAKSFNDLIAYSDADWGDALSPDDLHPAIVYSCPVTLFLPLAVTGSPHFLSLETAFF